MASGLRLSGGRQEGQRRLESLGCAVLLKEGEGGKGEEEGASLMGREEEGGREEARRADAERGGCR